MIQNLMPLLDQFSQDLTALAQDGKLDPIVGRNHEIGLLAELLCQNSNVLLVGSRGVGKTAIVEGLAQRIAFGRVPFPLRTKRIRHGDEGSFLLNAAHPASSERLARFAEALSVSKSILYVQNLDTIFVQRPVSDIAIFLKAAIEQQKFLCIASMPSSDYQEWQTRDPTLSKAFQAIQVDEPSIEEAVAIVRGIRVPYEQHHKLEITDEAIEAAVRLSAKFIPERAFPSKAIDLIDEAAARVRLNAAQRRRLDEERASGNAELAQATPTLSNTIASLIMSPGAVPKGLRLTREGVAEVVALWTGKPLAEIK